MTEDEAKKKKNSWVGHNAVQKRGTGEPSSRNILITLQ